MADTAKGASFQPGDYIALVPIRAGSKGMPGKNVRPFAGLPWYEHAVRQGLRCCSACIVSTDIEQVLAADVPDGRVLHRRAAHLAADTSPMDDVLKDAIEQLKLAGVNIVLLQATSPLRSDAAIARAIARHRKAKADLVMSVTPAERTILKWGLIEGSRFAPVHKPDYCFANRQDLPEIYRPNGAVYVFSSDWFMGNGGLSTDNIDAVIMPADQSCDIDSEDDFLRAEKLFASLNRGAA